jgi:oligosaccharyltransferase complex subunit beta
MQLEFTMLDPHYRIPLPPAPAGSAPGTYSASFIAPDRHGVFKFVVNYFRPGFSHLQVADKASVVPLRHDEHPRFIVGAYPFYAGALSTSAAFLFFVVLWIRLGESDKRTKTAKTE